MPCDAAQGSARGLGRIKHTAVLLVGRLASPGIANFIYRTAGPNRHAQHCTPSGVDGLPCE